MNAYDGRCFVYRLCIKTLAFLTSARSQLLKKTKPLVADLLPKDLENLAPRSTSGNNDGSVQVYLGTARCHRVGNTLAKVPLLHMHLFVAQQPSRRHH